MPLVSVPHDTIQEAGVLDVKKEGIGLRHGTEEIVGENGMGA